MSHQFAVGEQVGLRFGFHDREAEGAYAVVRLLPSLVNGEPQYRIRGSDDRERVIGEAQIKGAATNRNWGQRPKSAHNPFTEILNRLR